MEDPRRHIETHGYVVIRDVLTRDEIDRLRQVGRETFASGGRKVPGGGQKVANAAVELPGLRFLYHHPRVLAAFRAALGVEDIMFTSHADLQKDVLNGWHKDDGTDPANPAATGYFSRKAYDLDDCRVYKCGAYLQDHSSDRNGLWVRDGSHRQESYEAGEVVYTAPRAGDLVLFDVRITHSGQFKTYLQQQILRLARKVPAAKLEQRFTRARKLYRDLVRRERIASFFTFGLPNQHTVEFARNNMKRQLALTPGSQQHLPEDLRQTFEKAGVKLAERLFTL